MLFGGGFCPLGNVLDGSLVFEKSLSVFYKSDVGLTRTLDYVVVMTVQYFRCDELDFVVAVLGGHISFGDMLDVKSC